ncbi:MAG: hypothetical protein QF411_07835, partial [Planctomycetota bacterium]|nr:hypothetical protein [Planctomycetota bacterium]
MKTICNLPSATSCLALLVLAGLLSPQQRKLGYEDTPRLPGSSWRVHDGKRPQPRTVAPGAATGTATGATTGVSFPVIPVASTDVSDIAFSVVDIGAPGTPTGFTVTNAGSETLTLTDVSSPDAQFAVTTPALPLTLLEGETSGPISVDFTPSYVGDERTSLVLVHDGKRGSTVLAHGVGRVEPPVVDLANTRIVFASDRRLGDGTRDIY